MKKKKQKQKTPFNFSRQENPPKPWYRYQPFIFHDRQTDGRRIYRARSSPATTQSLFFFSRRSSIRFIFSLAILCITIVYVTMWCDFKTDVVIALNVTTAKRPFNVSPEFFHREQTIGSTRSRGTFSINPQKNVRPTPPRCCIRPPLRKFMQPMTNNR